MSEKLAEQKPQPGRHNISSCPHCFKPNPQIRVVPTYKTRAGTLMLFSCMHCRNPIRLIVEKEDEAGRR